MLNYFIQILFFQTLFFVVYEVMLKKETFFTGNRVYLLATQILVLIIPLLHISKLQEIIPSNYAQVYTQANIRVTQILTPQNETTIKSFEFHWEWLFYIGSIIMLGVFFLKIKKLYTFIKSGQLLLKNNFKIVSVNIDFTAFSFLNYIFIGSNLTEEKKQQIITHELVHIKDRHSWDLLFFELLRILFWFNPFIYLYQKRITEVHEFIVDNKLNTSNANKKEYYKILLSDAFNTETISFVNSFYNTSLIKKRIQMLTKMKSKNRQLLKYLVVIPTLLFSLTYVSYSKEIIPEKPTKKRATLKKTPSPEINKYQENPPKEIANCLNIIPKFDYKTPNSLTLENNDKSLDAVVALIFMEGEENELSIKKETTIRIAYIKKGKSQKMRNIPKGKYFLKIAKGNNWHEKNDNGICKGEFRKNASYSINTNAPLDFNPVRTKLGVEIPSYQIDIGILKGTEIDSFSK